MARTTSKAKSKGTIKEVTDVPSVTESIEQMVTDIPSVTEVIEQATKAPVAPVTSEELQIPAKIERLMKLYPHYKEMYISKNGFVHPVGAPLSVIKDAVLYKNKFYKQ